MPGFKILMGFAVLACVAASATFAFEFGWTRGATEVHRWTFAIASVTLDLLKSGLPILGALAWHERNVGAHCGLLAGVCADGSLLVVRLRDDRSTAGPRRSPTRWLQPRHRKTTARSLGAYARSVTHFSSSRRRRQP
jgi:hypothetical protein